MFLHKLCGNWGTIYPGRDCWTMGILIFILIKCCQLTFPGGCIGVPPSSSLRVPVSPQDHHNLECSSFLTSIKPNGNEVIS